MAQTYKIPSDSLFITTLSIIETYPWAWECACIAHLYWNGYDAKLVLSHCPWFNAFMSGIYVLKCRFNICLNNRFMNVRPQVPVPPPPPPPQHLPEQTQSFLSYPLNFSKTLMKLRKRFLKKLTYKWAVRNVSPFFGRNVLNTLVADECNSVTLVSFMGAVGLGATASRHLDWNFVMWEEFHGKFLLSEVGSFG